MGTSIEDITKVLDSIYPWQRDLLTKMFQHEIELEILYGSPERRRDDMKAEVRANLQGTNYNLVIMDEDQQKGEPMPFPRKCGKTNQFILKVLKSMTSEQYALVNKMVQDELEHRILEGSPAMRRFDTIMRVRENLKKTY